VSSNVVQFPWRPKHLHYEESRAAADRAMAVPVTDRPAQSRDLHLDDPELLLCVCESLHSLLEADPARVRDEAAFFFGFIREPKRPIGLHDERDYFLGELALLVAASSRFLFRIHDAKAWLQRAEASFSLVHNANAHWARVAYQRLALLLEERNLDEVRDLAPMWVDSFLQLGMREEALKCRFLIGIVHFELGEVDQAIEVFAAICAEAEKLGSEKLTAQAANNLARYYGALGDEENALSYARKALPIQKRLNDRVGFTKLQWSVGDMLRKQGKRAAALDAYREAQGEAREVGLRGDLAALHLVVADLLLEAGQEAQAEWEIRAALPIIDEEKMVPEGIAALSLLRDSLRRRQIDKQALRDLHGYFQEK
jgi:tetratricopeptide (TPR) repeat protein